MRPGRWRCFGRERTRGLFFEHVQQHANGLRGGAPAIAHGELAPAQARLRGIERDEEAIALALRLEPRVVALDKPVEHAATAVDHVNFFHRQLFAGLHVAEIQT